MIDCDREYSPSIGGSSAVGPGAPDVGVLVLVTELKAQVVDDVTCVLHNIGALAKISLDGNAANVLKGDDVVGVGGGREPGQDSLLSEQKRSGTDGEESAPAFLKLISAKRVLRDETVMQWNMCLLSLGARLLDLTVGRDEGKRLGLGLDDGLCISAEDDDNVKVLNALMGLLE